MIPVINKRKCPALKDVCKVIEACPPHAISYVEDENEPFGGKIIIDEALCDDCGVCVTECCGQAIEMLLA